MVSGIIRTTCLWLCLGLTLSAPLRAAEKPRIGLVLGGGGARGAAHVGVLKVLEREGVAVDFIAGTSMGAIIGALYASGYSADELENILAGIEWDQALSDASPRELQSMQRKIDERTLPSRLEVGFRRGRISTPQGLVQGQHLNLLLRHLTAQSDASDRFDDLPIPFRAVACDIASGEAVVLAEGDLVNAVRASMSVPGVFQPVRINGRLLVDGGVADNVPIAVARSMGADRLIVVDVGSPLLDEGSLNNPLAVTQQVFSVLIQKQTDAALATLGKDDLLIRPALKDINSAQFDRSVEAIALGEISALEQREAIAAFAADPERLAAFKSRQNPGAGEQRRIGSIAVEASATRTAQRIGRRLDDLRGQPFNATALEQRIAAIYGEGRHQHITYTTAINDDDTVHVLVRPVDKSWGPDFTRMGMKFSNNFEGDTAFQLDSLTRVHSELAGDSEWRFKLGLGERDELGIEWFNPFNGHERWFIRPVLNWRAFTQRGFTEEQSQELARFRWQRARAGIELGFDFSSTTRLGLRVERGIDKLRLLIGPSELSGLERQHDGMIAAEWFHDSLNHADFPTRGHRFISAIEYHSQSLGATQSETVLRFDWQHAQPLGEARLISGVRAVSALDDRLSLPALGFLGGLGNLSGFRERQLAGPHLFLARGVVLKRLGEANPLNKFPLYFGGSIEAGNTWLTRREAGFDDLIYSASLFFAVDTPLGPVFLGYGRSDRDDQALYLQFGGLINQTE